MASPELAFGALLLIWLGLYAVGKSKRLKAKGLDVRTFFFIYRTERMNEILNRLASRPTFWRQYSNLGVGVAFFSMGYVLTFLVYNLFQFYQEPHGASSVTLLIPGLTIQSPQALIYFALSVPIILIIHEGGHGIIARVEKIKVKSGGFGAFLTFIFGFVEPDEEEFRKSPRKSRLRVLSAGSTSNLAFSLLLIAFLILDPRFAYFLPDPARGIFYSNPQGLLIAYVQPGLPAEQAGIRTNDIIIRINGLEIKSPSDLNNAIIKPGQSVELTYLRGGTTLEARVVAVVHPEVEGRGILGFSSFREPYYPQRIGYGLLLPNEVFSLVIWLWLLSLNIGLFNMLPIYPMDGDGLVKALTSGLARARTIRVALNVVGIVLIAGNLVASIARAGIAAI